MRKLKISCQGAYPMMMDKMSDAVLNSLASGVRVQINKERSDVEVSKEKIYRNEEGLIGLPATMIYAALVVAGREVALKGRTNISTATNTKLFGLMEIEEEFMPFPVPELEKETPWVVDKRPGRLPVDGTAICLRRPKFAVWGFNCTVNIDERLIDPKKIVELFYSAGKFQGLGSFRPNKKGPFGRFIVMKAVDITPAAWKVEGASNIPAIEMSDPDDVPVEVESSETGDGKLVSVGGNNGEVKIPRGRLAESNA